jgi:hypothetical protein
MQELGNGQFCRQISFNVLYEFEQLPEQSSGTISELIMRHEVGLGPSAKFLANLFFDSDPLAQFTPVDDPAATTDAPSQWRFNEPQARVEQLSRIRGGTLSLVDYQKAGTYLLLNGASCRDFILNTELFSDSVDGVGAILRWRNVDNFYFFLMSNRGSGYCIFGKKVNGSFAALASGGERVDIEYPRDRRIALKIILADTQFEALMDEVVILRGQDSDIDSPGQVGFMTQGNDSAHFFNLNLTSFDSD